MLSIAGFLTQTSGFTQTDPVGDDGPKDRGGALVQDGFVSAALAFIKSAEYDMAWQNHASAYQSPNREQNLRFTYFSDGFSAEPRELPDDGVVPWRLGIRLEALGKSSLPSAPIHLDGGLETDKNVASLRNPEIEIQYINAPEGMRQNFLIKSRPEGLESLVLDFAVELENLSMDVDPLRNHVSFLANQGSNEAMRYTDLKEIRLQCGGRSNQWVHR